MKPWPRDWPAHVQDGGNVPCDAACGPCACGAWHAEGEFRFEGGVLYRLGRPVAPRRGPGGA